MTFSGLSDYTAKPFDCVLALFFACFYLFLVILQWPTKCVIFSNIYLPSLFTSSKYL